MPVRRLFIESILDNPNHAQAKLAHFIVSVLLNRLFMNKSKPTCRVFREIGGTRKKLKN
jgi:hypothetical protein